MKTSKEKVKYLVAEPEGISQFTNKTEALKFYEWKTKVRPLVTVALISGFVLKST